MTASIAQKPVIVHTNLEETKDSVPHYDFAFTPFLRQEYRFGVSPARPYCKAFREGFCPLGNACPDKHPVTHSTNNLVCKHWLKGLCKKGDQCDFLHEYNIRMRAECTHHSRGYCVSGDDCNYLHLDPWTRLPPCPHYEKGFCPLGPNCGKKHIKRILCRFYLAGFCPYGRQCKEGSHPRFPEDLPKPTVKVARSANEVEVERDRYKEEVEQREQRDWDRNEGNRRDGRGRGGKRVYGRGGRKGGFDR